MLSKSWCFASNDACIQHVASRCTHQHKHASIAGIQSSSGQYLSTLTAEYPASLAACLIKHCEFKVSAQPEVRNLRKPSLLSLHPVHAFDCTSTKPPAHQSSTRLAAMARRTKTHPTLEVFRLQPSHAGRRLLEDCHATLGGDCFEQLSPSSVDFAAVANPREFCWCQVWYAQHA